MAATGHSETLDTPAPDFALPGVDGRTWTLADCRGPRGLLVVFMCNHCPYVMAIKERLVRDARELQTLGIGVVGINANDPLAYPQDSFEQMKLVARDWHLPFPYLFDASQEVAQAYGAVCTPDFFGFNAAGQLQYRGRLDASRKEAAPPDAPRELFEAMQCIAATGSGPQTQHPSIGCSIKWRPSC